MKQRIGVMTRVWRDSPREFKLLVTLIIVIAVTMTLTVVWVLLNATFRTRVEPPPFRYGGDVRQPDGVWVIFPKKDAYCGDEPLTFDLPLEISGAPYVALVAQGIEQPMPDGTFRIVETQPLLARPVTDNQPLQKFANSIAHKPLAPGVYEYRRVAQAFLTDVAAVKVPFRVIECVPMQTQEKP